MFKKYKKLGGKFFRQVKKGKFDKAIGTGLNIGTKALIDYNKLATGANQALGVAGQLGLIDDEEASQYRSYLDKGNEYSGIYGKHLNQVNREYEKYYGGSKKSKKNKNKLQDASIIYDAPARYIDPPPRTITIDPPPYKIDPKPVEIKPQSNYTFF
jgi:hypothetical protein